MRSGVLLLVVLLFLPGPGVAQAVKLSARVGETTIALGCGSGTLTPDLTVSAIAFTPATPDTLFSIGDTLKIVASANDRTGIAVPGEKVSFSSSANTVATVTEQGVVVAVGSGTATITGTSRGVSGIVTVRVRQKLASVTMAPPTGGITLTRTITVLATGRDARGSSIGGLPAASYSSSNNTVASVTSAGVVTGNALGQATITASIASTADGTKSGTSVITVSATPPSTATVTMGAASFAPTSTEIAVGGTVTWTNPSGVQHDVDFGTGAAQHIPVFDSGTKSLTFQSAGTFMYFCNLHAGMTGTVVVR